MKLSVLKSRVLGLTWCVLFFVLGVSIFFHHRIVPLSRIRRIVHGLRPTDPNLYQSSVVILYGGDALNYSVCGGEMIQKHWVLTSVSCIDPAEIHAYKVMKPNGKENGFTVPVLRILPHPQYREVNNSRQHDIMLVEILLDGKENPVKFGTLADNNTIIPEKAIIFGYGQYDNIGLYDEQVVQHSEIPIIMDDNCTEKMEEYFEVIPEQICVGFEKGGVGPCGADAGGPLYAQNGEEYIILGLASMVSPRPCGEGPSVYTEVSHYIPWIQRYIPDVKIADPPPTPTPAPTTEASATRGTSTGAPTE